jgi:hypothetical protein
LQDSTTKDEDIYSFRASEFVPFEMLKAIPDPEKMTTEADIEVQLQEAFVSTIAAIDLSLDDSFCVTEAETIEGHNPLAF